MTRAPLSLPGRTVIFDFGEVISLPPSPADRAAIARLAGIDEEPHPGAPGDRAQQPFGGERGELFWRAYHAHRAGLDRGTLGAIAYWQAIAGEMGMRLDEARMYQLWAADFRSWLSINAATIEILSDLRAGKTSLALLSNAGPDFGSYFRHGPLAGFFTGIYVSGELGLLKPDAAIYEHVLSDLNIPAEEAVFIDNRAANVAGAEAVGITGHVFTTVSELRAFLTSLACWKRPLD